jgi:hypothetical protein
MSYGDLKTPPGSAAKKTSRPRRGQSLFQVRDDVIDVFDADAQAYHVSVTPADASSSADSCRCVVEAGCAASDLASPILTSRLNSLSAS